MGDKVELPPLKFKEIAVAGNTRGDLALYGLDEGPAGRRGSDARALVITAATILLCPSMPATL